ncbi:MAG TPA: SDR family oxidoreductase [Longimicrobiales bacterium]
MSAGAARASTIAALAAGVTLGAATSAGTALLLYTGQGFLRAAGLLVSSMLMAVAAGLWAGAPEPATRSSARARWATLSIALIAGGIFSGLWNAREALRGHALGGALAVLLILALPAYTAGSLLAALHARNRRDRGGGAVATGAIAGSAVGILLATTLLIQALAPYAIYFGAAILVSAASLLDRRRATMYPASGDTAMIDHVVIVTGVGDAGQLGYTIARRFLEAGARVVISARSPELPEIAASLRAHGEVMPVHADLTNDAHVDTLIGRTREQFGRLDALVNVAGGLSVIAAVEDTTPAEWQREIERNAGTVLRVTRAALPLLRESHGTVVNFAAPAAARAPAKLAAYSAAKAAVVALTRSLAIEEKANGVRANAIAPGLMDTEQNRAAAGTAATFVTREDVAAVALFLAGPASAGITGETVQVLGATIQ